MKVHSMTQPPTSVAVLDIETLAPPAPNGGFPPWPTHRPLIASVLTADQVQYGEWKFGLESIEFDDEPAAIHRIDELLKGRRAVSYNGRGFDFPVLAATAMRCSAYECMNLTDAWASHRFSGGHMDLADVISGFGAAPRTGLEMLCNSLGISVKTNGHGANVAEMLRDRGIDAVKRYCEEDVASTLAAFAMVQALRSNRTSYAATLICDFANWVVDAGHAHLDAFRQLAGNSVLERARLQHRLDEGIAAMDDRATVAFWAAAEASSPTPRQNAI